MKKRIISLVAALASLVPVIVLADGMPPESKEAPSAAAETVTQADLQPNAPDEYTVVKGDTLWGISGRFLKDPWRWPQIWQMNRDQIKDPHWIYPGDVIRLDRSGAYPRLTLNEAGPEAAAANVVKLDPRVRVEPLRTAITTIPGTAIGPFLSQPLVVEENGLAGAPEIVATEESRVVVGAGDTAYADRIGANDGVNWQVFRQGGALRDPDTGEILGYEARYVADARVRRFGNPSTLMITKARQEVNRGDRLMPAREVTLPSYMPRAPDKLIRGAIITVDGGVSELGQFQIVALNRGARDGLQVGNVLATYRRGALISADGHQVGSPIGGWEMDIKPSPVVPPNPAELQADDKPGATLRGKALRLPDERNGLVFVFRVFQKLSYALVMQSSKPIYVGDVVQSP